MLRMTARKSAPSAKFYYDSELVRQEYYSENQQTAGRWGGKGAEQLGLQGIVTREAFAALCDNLHPATGQRLTLRLKANRTVGYDLNFNAPKSLSLLYAFTQDKRLLEAFRKSVNDTMLEIEADAMTRVRRKGQNFNRPTGNLAWAEFIHMTARPENGVSDPHLHAHLMTFNATFDDMEDRWKAGQFREINRDMPYYQAAFHSRLAQNLQALGFEITPQKFGFEIAGMPEPTLEKFSQRTQRIEKEAEERGITDAKAKAKLGALTRAPKLTHLSADEGMRASLARLTPEEQSFLQTLSKVQPVQRTLDPEIENRVWAYIRERVFERQSVLSEKEFLAEVLRSGQFQLDPAKLRARLAADTTLIRQTIDGRLMLTTPHVLAEEQRLVAWVQKGHGAVMPLAPSHAIRDERLSDEQRAAVRHTLQSTDRVTGVQGKAGTGKTTLMRETISAIEARGHKVLVLAPTAEASRGLLRKEGFANADTIQQLLTHEEMQADAAGCIWWVDEAGLISVPDMARLTDLAEKLNARLILSGDTAQHRSVQRGDALRVLVDHAGLKLAKLRSIRRQSGIFREAVECLSEGNIKDGFAKLDALGAIHEIPNDNRHQFLADAYLNVIRKGESSLVISPTHAECRKVTEIIRQGLKAGGELKEERRFSVLRPLDLYEADKKRLSTYRPGWIIEMVQSVPGLRAGTRVVVSSIDDEDLFVRLPNTNVRRLDIAQYAGRFQVYEHGTLDVAVGDRIRITKGGHELFGKRRLNNGSLHTVKGFTESGDLQLDNGMFIADTFAHMTHGYATTSYASQGKTVQHVFIAEGSESFPAANREQFYVSVSRAFEAVHIVTDCKQRLFEAVQTSSQRLAALDITKVTPPTLPLDYKEELVHAQARAEQTERAMPAIKRKLGQLVLTPKPPAIRKLLPP